MPCTRFVSVFLYDSFYSQASIRYRVGTPTLFGSQRPATDPDITASALTGKHPTSKLAFSVLDYKNWSQSVHGRTRACHARRRGSLPLGTAKFCRYWMGRLPCIERLILVSLGGSNPLVCTKYEATPPGHFLARALGPATVASL